MIKICKGSVNAYYFSFDFQEPYETIIFLLDLFHNFYVSYLRGHLTKL